MQKAQDRPGGWAAAAEMVTVVIGAAALVASLVILLAHGGLPGKGSAFQALFWLVPTAVIAGVIVSYRNLRKARIPIRTDEEIEKKVEEKVEKKMDQWMGP